VESIFPRVFKERGNHAEVVFFQIKTNVKQFFYKNLIGKIKFQNARPG